jgi:quercetin dioxygenase-like cupin family protein
MHRAITLGIGTVCEGELEFSLDSGEARKMKPGDVSVNRGTMHKWKNVTDKPARMMYFLVDVEPMYVNGKKMEMEMGTLGDEYSSL